jgi:hypothetical protein
MTYYGAGWASSPIRDLAPKYANAIADDLNLSSKCVDLMIEKGWQEQPPFSENRRKINYEKIDLSS